MKGLVPLIVVFAGLVPAMAATGADAGSLFDAAEDAFNTLIRSGEQVADEVLGLTPAEESAWGEAFHEAILETTPPLEDEELQAALDDILAFFVTQSARTEEITYRVTLLDDRGISAFAVAGGYTYITVGLMEAYAYDFDAIMFVVGHEVAHIELGHCRRAVTPLARGAELGGAALGELMGMLRFLAIRGYARDKEFEADAWSYDAMAAMGKPKEARLKAIRGLRDIERRHGIAEASEQEPGDFIAMMERYMSTHPPTTDRIQRLEER